MIWSNSTFLVSSGLFILEHSNSKFSMGNHKGIYGNEIVRLNETYTVSWSLIKISYTIIHIPTLSPCPYYWVLLGPRIIFWAFKYEFQTITWLVLYVNPKGIYGIWNLYQTSTYCVKVSKGAKIRSRYNQAGLKISWNRHLPCITKNIGIYGKMLIYNGNHRKFHLPCSLRHS